ncbi:uncharacterized protein [Periplaneta americana]|uniref:uncharacterized protein n=1 Tax=Periplaneta americana TaxID=6978 RepID=UPI0037E7F4B2
MKVLSLVLLAVVFVSAKPEPEAPRFRYNSYGVPAEVEEAPYPPSGWRPSGRQFFLPARQSSYYAPPVAYGPPTTTEQPTEEPTTTEVPTTTEPETSAELADGNGADPSVADRERDGQSSGVYHILLPDGRLQRITFSAQPNQPNGALQAYGAPSQGVSAGYVAQVQYQDVEPIRSPIYTFSAPLVRIFK